MEIRALSVLTILLIGNPAIASDDGSNTIIVPGFGFVDAGTNETLIETDLLDDTNFDAVGLIPRHISGLPTGLWKNSQSDTIINLISRQTSELPSSILELLYIILLAEAEPPEDSSGNGELFLARVDKLIEFGALEHSKELLRRAGTSQPNLFKRWFDISILTRSEYESCSRLLAKPDLLSSYAGHIFCSVRLGNWFKAESIFNIAQAVGEISDVEIKIINAFLNSDLLDEGNLLTFESIDTLMYRMLVDSSYSYKIDYLPELYANLNLLPEAAWRDRIESAELLVGNLAIPFEHLILIYSEHIPPSSGGIWNRVRTLQSFEDAIKLGDLDAINAMLGYVLQIIQGIGLEVQFAGHYVKQLQNLGLSSTDSFDFRVMIALSGITSNPNIGNALPSAIEPTVSTIDLFNVDNFNQTNSLWVAIVAGLNGHIINSKLLQLIEHDKLGEALLEAMLLIDSEDGINPHRVQDMLGIIVSQSMNHLANKFAIQMSLRAQN